MGAKRVTNEVREYTNNEMMFDFELMERMQKIAVTMAEARVTIPAHLHKSPADCLAVILQAAQWKMNPYAVAQKTHLVNGTLGYEAQLVNAVISSSRAIEGRFKYEYKDWTTSNGLVRVGAKLRGDSEITWGEWLNTATVQTKNSPLWKTAPKQQGSYLALKYWARIYTPDVILGVYDKEELLEKEKEREINPLPAKTAAEDIIISNTPAKAEAIDKETGEILSSEESIYDDYVKAFSQSETISDLIKVAEMLQSEENLSLKERKDLRQSYKEKHKEIEAQKKSEEKSTNDVNEFFDAENKTS